MAISQVVDARKLLTLVGEPNIGPVIVAVLDVLEGAEKGEAVTLSPSTVKALAAVFQQLSA